MLPLAILAGGYASRLGSLTKDVPKCLIEINGRTFVDWQLDLLVKNGYSEFVFCVSHKSELIQEYLGDGSDRGIKLQYSFDGDKQLGTGGAIQKALPKLGKAFGVIYGDSYLPIDFSVVEREFISLKSSALMVIYKNHNELDASNVEFLEGILVDYNKGAESKNMHHIDYGITFFREEAFRPWRDQSSFDLSLVCHQLAKEKQLNGFEVFERFYEIGSVLGIQEFSRYLLEAPHEL